MKFNVYIFILLIVVGNAACAQEEYGVWKYQRSTEYSNQIPNIQPPKYTTIEVTSGVAKATGCVAEVKKTRFLYSSTFQPLLKEGVELPQLVKYLDKTYHIPFVDVTSVYKLKLSPDCDREVREFFVFGDKMLVPVGGSIFHLYNRMGKSASASISQSTNVAGLKISALPFNGDQYVDQCLPKILDKNGVSHSSDKCGPAFFPYVADAKEKSPLVQAIGTHNYIKGGARHGEEFAAPFANGMHPVFVLFPPLNDVQLVRVNDFDVGKPESREMMSGVYLTIKNGAVIDQIDGSCDFDAKYVCSDSRGYKMQLLSSGKFAAIKN